MTSKRHILTKEEYEQYLLSDHWKSFSNKVRSSRLNCEDCGIEARKAYKRDRQKLNVHHLTYKRLGKEKPEDVVLVCHYCHLKRHGIEGFYEWCQKFSMPDVGKGSQQRCANCGVVGGHTVFNVDEVMSEWLCVECRK